MKETEQKIKGQWFTPDNIADEMVNMTPTDWWSKGILEPTCGNGNLVIRILNEKLNHGLSPIEALNTTWANEIDSKYANECTERVKSWAKDKGINTNWSCMNEDSTSYDFRQISYEYVWTNLPFGCYGGAGATLPRSITKNVVKSEAILITKSTSLNKYIKEYKILDFPGIKYKCQISHYDLKCTESVSWLDKYKSLMNNICKWKVNDNSYTHVVSVMTGTNKLLPLFPRDYYDKKGKSIPNKNILLKLTDEEYNKLNSYINPLYEDYYNEMLNHTIQRNKYILYGYINEALNESSKETSQDKEESNPRPED